MSDVTNTFDSVKNLVNIFVGFMPLGIYFFAYFTSIIFNDKRGGLLMLGMFLNDLVGFFNKRYIGSINSNENCGIFKSNDSSTFELPNKHTEIISFFSSIFYSEMYKKKKTNWFTFIFLLIMIIITVWSRMNVGCENDFSKIIFSILSGVTRGMLFYYFFSKQWNDAEAKDSTKKVACDYQSDNYTCETIKDGKVIIEDPVDTDNDEKDETNN